MTNRHRTVFLAAAAVTLITANLHAGNDEFFKSVGVLFNISMNTGYGAGIDRVRIRVGVFSNLFIFNGSELGYYINPMLGVNIRSGPPYGQAAPAPAPADPAADAPAPAPDGSAAPPPPPKPPSPHQMRGRAAPAPLDIYLGVTGGPAWLLYDSDNFDALIGAGVDLGVSLYLDEGKSMNMALGLGLGYSLEGRMNFDGNLGIAAGLSWHGNFFPAPGTPGISFWPYIGVGF